MQNQDSYTICDLSSDTVEIKGYNFDYFTEHSLIDDVSFSNENYVNEELEYRKFVYENYMNIPNSTKSVIDDFIAEKDLNGDSLLDSVQRIINLFKSEYLYNISNLECYNADDYVVSFLTDTKIGKCDIFASAGAIILRALGYPTRVICGYGMNGECLDKIYYNPTCGHAQCQVYIDGKGWVTFEFTVAPLAEGEEVPTPDGADEEGNAFEDTSYDQTDKGEGGGTTVGGGDLTDFSLHIYSGTQSFTYDGKEHWYGDYEIKGDLKEGHYIEINGWSTITKVGQTVNDFSFVLKDEDGNVVNDEYVIEKSTGTISVTKRDLNIRSNSFNSSFYNISSLKDEEIYEVEGLAEGDKIVGSIVLIKNASKPSTYQNVVIINKIVNEKGEDVTSCYNILYDYGTVVLS